MCQPRRQSLGDGRSGAPAGQALLRMGIHDRGWVLVDPAVLRLEHPPLLSPGPDD
jgi:hypothetical protein